MRVSALLPVAFPALLVSCHLFSKSTGAKPAHVPRDPTTASSPSQWIEADQALFSKAAKVPPGFILASDSVLTRQVQSWLDRIDATVRAGNPDAASRVPKPRAVVIKAAEMNAFVQPAFVCFEGMRATLNASPQGGLVQNPEVAWFDPSRARIVPKGRSDCDATSSDKALLAEMVDTYNRKVQAADGCRLGFDGTAISFSGRCDVPQNLGSSGIFAFPRVMNTIAVYAGILSRLSEEAAFSVIAHELGHYYRAHSAGSPETDQYFYEEKLRDSPVRPPRLTDESLREKFEILARVSQEEHLLIEEGMALHPSVLRNFSRSTIMGRLVRACRGRSCEASCQQADAALAGFKETLRRYVEGAPFSSAEKETYLNVEGRLLACSKEVRVGDGEGGIGAFQVQNTFEISAQDVVSMTASTGTLEELARNVSQARLERQRRIESILAEMAQRGLGFYTSEEEADNFALEMMAENGMKPASAKEVYFRILKDRELTGAVVPVRSVASLMLHSHARCKELDGAGWMQDGKPITIPFGVSLEPHHAECYRVFNVEREIRAHGYAPHGERPALLVPWDRLANLAMDAAVEGWSGSGPGSGN